MPPRVLESWVQQQTYFNDSSLTAPPASGTINAAITDGSGISRTLTVSGASLKVEHAEVTVNLTHANAGDLILKFISPTGTESILMNRPGKTPGSTDAVDRGGAANDGRFRLAATSAAYH